MPATAAAVLRFLVAAAPVLIGLCLDMCVPLRFPKRLLGFAGFVTIGYPVEHLVVDVTADGERGARKFRYSAEDRRYVECAVYGSPRSKQTLVVRGLS